jgi:hypothetical protein
MGVAAGERLLCRRLRHRVVVEAVWRGQVVQVQLLVVKEVALVVLLQA